MSNPTKQIPPAASSQFLVSGRLAQPRLSPQRATDDSSARRAIWPRGLGWCRRAFDRGQTDTSGVSERGNRYVRRLIIHGARSCFLHLDRANHALGSWLSALEPRTHRNSPVVALANKLTRIVWAVLTKPGRVYLLSKGAALS